MDLGLLYRALDNHQVDIVAGNSTDGPIRALGFVVLADDLHYFPPYEAVPLVREDSLSRHPEIQIAMDKLAGKVTRRRSSRHERRRRRQAPGRNPSSPPIPRRERSVVMPEHYNQNPGSAAPSPKSMPSSVPSSMRSNSPKKTSPNGAPTSLARKSTPAHSASRP